MQTFIQYVEESFFKNVDPKHISNEIKEGVSEILDTYKKVKVEAYQHYELKDRYELKGKTWYKEFSKNRDMMNKRMIPLVEFLNTRGLTAFDLAHDMVVEHDKIKFSTKNFEKKYKLEKLVLAQLNDFFALVPKTGLVSELLRLSFKVKDGVIQRFDAKKKRIDAVKDVKHKEVKPNKKNLVSVRFPKMNKNNSMRDNDEEITKGFYTEDVEIKKTVTLSNEEFKKVSENLLADDKRWEKIGGRNIDEKYLEGVKEGSSDYYKAFREHGVTEAVKVINKLTKEVFYVNTEGDEYARYVGRDANFKIVKKLTPKTVSIDKILKPKKVTPTPVSKYKTAGKAIKAELKKEFPSVKFSIRQEGGSAVRISWSDGVTTKQVNDIVDKYQYGYFNAMNDIYEYSNTRADIPQVQFVVSYQTISGKYDQEILDWLKNKSNDFKNLELDSPIPEFFASSFGRGDIMKYYISRISHHLDFTKPLAPQLKDYKYFNR